MSKWTWKAKRNYDATGHLLLRIGSMFIGFYFGIVVGHNWTPTAYAFRALAALFAVTVFYFADRRAKVSNEDALKLRVQ